MELIKAVFPLIQSQLSWLPRNGASISLWTNSIMGNQPLGDTEDLQLLKEWSIRNAITKLADLSTWAKNCKWAGWKQMSPP
jgi:hypothetical protein